MFSCHLKACKGWRLELGINVGSNPMTCTHISQPRHAPDSDELYLSKRRLRGLQAFRPRGCTAAHCLALFPPRTCTTDSFQFVNIDKHMHLPSSQVMLYHKFMLVCIQQRCIYAGDCPATRGRDLSWPWSDFSYIFLDRGYPQKLDTRREVDKCRNIRGEGTRRTWWARRLGCSRARRRRRQRPIPPAPAPRAAPPAAACPTCIFRVYNIGIKT